MASAHTTRGVRPFGVESGSLECQVAELRPHPVGVGTGRMSKALSRLVTGSREEACQDTDCGPGTWLRGQIQRENIPHLQKWIDCSSYRQAKSSLLYKASSNQEMKETNGFPLDEN